MRIRPYSDACMKAGQLDASLRWIHQRAETTVMCLNYSIPRRLKDYEHDDTAFRYSSTELRPSRAASAARACSTRLSIWECLRFARPIQRLPTSIAARSTILFMSMSAEQCFLVQLEEYESAENIFSDYAYFSSFSDSWLSTARTTATR